MKRILFSFLIACAVIGVGVAYASVLTSTTGDKGTDGYRIETYSDGVVKFDSGDTVRVDGSLYGNKTIGIKASSPAAALQVGSGTPSHTAAISTTNDAYVAGDIEVDGMVYVDGAIYTDSSIYGSVSGVSFKAVTTCGCKTFVNGLCVEKGTCS